ncbi:MAG: hypothetical protein AAGJ87_01830 [Pseudomonadota bacterium]
MRDAIANLEERVDAIATTLLGTEEFAKTANLASNMQLRLQKGMNSHMSRQLALFNMPSRDDIAHIGERLMTMDERLVRIEALLKQLDAGAAPAKNTGMPPRTKKPGGKKSGARTTPPTKKARAAKKASS